MILLWIVPEKRTVCSGHPKQKRGTLVALLEHAIAGLNEFRVRLYVGVLFLWSCRPSRPQCADNRKCDREGLNQNLNLFDFAVAIEKLLHCPEWREVLLLGAAQQAEMDTELLVQRFGIVADDIKSTAFDGTFWSEGADDHMASTPYSAGDLTDIGDTIARAGKKMKDGAVVPHVVADGGSSTFVISAASQWTHSADLPSRFLFASMAVFAMSRTVMFSYPRARRSSTSVDSPPPTSMIDAERLGAAFSMSASDVSRCARYQLTSSGAFSL